MKKYKDYINKQQISERVVSNKDIVNNINSLQDIFSSNGQLSLQSKGKYSKDINKIKRSINLILADYGELYIKMRSDGYI